MVAILTASRSIVWDFDGTITTDGGFSEDIPPPRPEIVALMRRAQAAGLKNVIASCRWSVHELSTPEQAEHNMVVAQAYLAEWDIPYDELRMKPLGEVYVDDKAVHANDLAGIESAISKAKLALVMDENPQLNPLFEELGFKEPEKKAGPGRLITYDDLLKLVPASLKVEAAGDDHEWGCLMVDYPLELADRVKAWTAENVAEDALYKDPEDPSSYGRETHVHTTVAYGIDPKTDREDIQFLIYMWGRPIKVRLGKISKFEPDKYDVIKVDVESPELHSLHKELELQLEGLPGNTYPEYHPHLTLAYVEKGAADHLLGQSPFEGEEFELRNFDYSAPPAPGQPDKHTKYELPEPVRASLRAASDPEGNLLGVGKFWIDPEGKLFHIGGDTEHADHMGLPGMEGRGFKDLVRAGWTRGGLSTTETLYLQTNQPIDWVLKRLPAEMLLCQYISVEKDGTTSGVSVPQGEDAEEAWRKRNDPRRRVNAGSDWETFEAYANENFGIPLRSHLLLFSSAMEFTDRYEAMGMPHPDPKTVCHGQCEGTGWVPVSLSYHSGEDDPFRVLWEQAEAETPSEDGWHFVKCPTCSGSGKLVAGTTKKFLAANLEQKYWVDLNNSKVYPFPISEEHWDQPVVVERYFDDAGDDRDRQNEMAQEDGLCRVTKNSQALFVDIGYEFGDVEKVLSLLPAEALFVKKMIVQPLGNENGVMVEVLEGEDALDAWKHRNDVRHRVKADAEYFELLRLMEGGQMTPQVFRAKAEERAASRSDLISMAINEGYDHSKIVALIRGYKKDPAGYNFDQKASLTANKFDDLYRRANAVAQDDAKYSGALENPALAQEQGQFQQQVKDARSEAELQAAWARFQPSVTWEALLAMEDQPQDEDRSPVPA